VLYDFTATAGLVLNTTVSDAPDTAVRGVSVEEANTSDDGRPVSCETLCVGDVWGHNSSTCAFACECTNATHGRHFSSTNEITRDDEGCDSVVTTMGSLLLPMDARGGTVAGAERHSHAVI
jgi:hypothetical protein